MIITNFVLNNYINTQSRGGGENAFFFQILSTNSVRRRMKISLQNLYVDVEVKEKSTINQDYPAVRKWYNTRI